MILFDIFFQELNQEYGVNLDETLPVGSLIDSLVELIAQKEYLRTEQNPGLFLLCDPETRQFFHPAHSLAEYGIQAGQRLILL